jgi:RNAse (barnase) inhibitor barstar
MDFMRENQGCNAQDIVDGIKKDLSRGPIFDTLSELIKEGAVTNEKVNRREHRFFLNGDNPLVSIPVELDHFKDYFFKLIDEVNRRSATKITEFDKKYPDQLRDPMIKRSRLLYSLLALYQHLVGMYVLRSLSMWPKKIKDKEVINKLYTEVFNRLQEIQLKLTSELFAPSDEFRLYDIAVEGLFELKPDELHSVAHAFHRIGVDKQFESVLDSLWEISNKSIPFGLLGPLRIEVQHLMAKNGKLNDWRIFVR